MDETPLEPERLPERPPRAAPHALRATPAQRRIAWLVALAADALQVVIFPLFGPGAANPIVDALDVVVGLVLWRLLGWHVAFVPTFVAELLPFVDLFPSWTLAVAFVLRRRS